VKIVSGKTRVLIISMLLFRPLPSCLDGIKRLHFQTGYGAVFLNGLMASKKFHSSQKLSDDADNSVVSKAIKSISSSTVNGQFSTAEVKPPLISRIKEGVLHYWHGSKLLAFETKVSSRLLWKMLLGHKLIRRERRQLRRTVSDLLRLVPFVVIMIIPFLEFALPVILKLFPNMLPSTFEDKTTFVCHHFCHHNFILSFAFNRKKSERNNLRLNLKWQSFCKKLLKT
jgi:hypothetical protein